MKALKAITLIALAVAITAVVGVGTASAVTLCQVNSKDNKCPVGKEYPQKQTIEGKLLPNSNVRFIAYDKTKKLFEAVCNESKLIWETIKNNGPGKILNGTVKTLDFTKCMGNGACDSAEALRLPYNAELLFDKDFPGNGPLWFSNGGKGKPGMRLENCGIAGVNCNYQEGMQTELEVIGGTPAQVKFIELFPREGGNPLCGEDVEIRVTYEVTTPKTVYVEKEP